MRIRGGALAASSAGEESPFGWRYRLYRAEKEAIALLAERKVRDGDIIALDVGTTVLYLARRLARRRITVVTNSLHAASLLADGSATVILTGGSVRPGERSLVGVHALSTLSNYRFDHMFLSVGGISCRGVTDFNVPEVEVKQEILRRSDRAYALADSSKFGRSAGIVVTALGSLTAILAATAPSAEAVAEVTGAGGCVEFATDGFVADDQEVFS